MFSDDSCKKCECEDDESEGDSLSSGGVVGITLSLTLLVSLPVGVVIGCLVMWCMMRSRVDWEQREKVELQEGVIYEEACGPVVKTDIPLSPNQAYGQVHTQRSGH